MKKSEELKKKSAEEENDLVALGIGKKIIREERNETFEEKWLPELKTKFGDKIQYIEKMFCWRITTDTMTDFYPKANKVFIHNKRVWIKPGLKYLIENLLKK